MMLHVAMYLRISRKEKHKLTDESNSIQNQKKLLKAYLMKDEILSRYPVEEYCDDGYSGTHFERPDVQRLLEDIRRHKIYALIVKDFSRFSRDYIELGSFRDMIFPRNNVRFISVKDNYDSSAETPGMIGIAVSSLTYDLYSKDLSEKVKSVFHAKCRNGEWPFGEIPLGYERAPEEEGGVREKPEEAEIVRRIFSEAYQGMGTCQIARGLNTDRIPTCSQIRGKQIRTIGRINWNASAVRHVLKNKFYIGEVTFNKSIREVGGRKSRQRPKDEWITMKDHHKGLISADVFHAVQVHGEKIRQKKGRHPLAGKLFCGGCGHTLIYKSGKKGRRFECVNSSYVPYKECCTYFRADVLEELILYRLNQELTLRLDQARSQEVRYQQLLKEKGKLEKELTGLDRERGLLRQKKRSDYETYVFGKLNRDFYLEETARDNGKMEEINKKIAEKKRNKERIEEMLNNLDPKVWDILKEMNTVILSQELVDFFIEKIIVYRDKRVEVFWKFSFGNLPENISDKREALSGL